MEDTTTSYSNDELEDDLQGVVPNVDGFLFHLSQMSLTRNEQLVKICCMTISCFLSILGSGTILFFCRKKLHRIYHRLLFLLSISDLFFSISYICQPYSIPKHYQVPYGIGTITSCRIVGFFFLTFSLIGCLLNCCLSYYFYMTIVQGKTEYYLVRTNLEKKWYALCICIPLTLSITGLFQSAINPDSYSKLCTFDGIPAQPPPIPGFKLALIWFGIILVSSGIGFRCTYLVYSKVRKHTQQMNRYKFENRQHDQHHCHQPPPPPPQQQQQQPTSTDHSDNHSHSSTTNGGGGPTENLSLPPPPPRRFSNISSIFSSFQSRTSTCSDGGGGGGSGSVSVLLGGGRRMALLRSKESNISSRSGGTTTTVTSSQKRVTAVGIQAVLYSFAYLNSIIWPSMVAIISAILSKNSGEYYILDLALWVFSPLQGFLNFFVYIRPTYIQFRHNYPEKSRLWALWQILEFDNTYIPPPSSRPTKTKKKKSHVTGTTNMNQSSSVHHQSTTLTTSSSFRGSGGGGGFGNRLILVDDATTAGKQQHPPIPDINGSNNNNNSIYLDVVNEVQREDSKDDIDEGVEDDDVDEEGKVHDDNDKNRILMGFQKSKKQLPREDGFMFDESERDIESISSIMKDEVLFDTTTPPSGTRRTPTMEDDDDGKQLNTTIQLEFEEGCEADLELGPRSQYNSNTDGNHHHPRDHHHRRSRTSPTLQNNRRQSFDNNLLTTPVHRNSTTTRTHSVSAFFDLDLDPESLQFEKEEDHSQNSILSSSQHSERSSVELEHYSLSTTNTAKDPNEEDGTSGSSRGRNRRTKSQPIVEGKGNSTTSGSNGGVHPRRRSMLSLVGGGGGGVRGANRRASASSLRNLFSLSLAWSSPRTTDEMEEGTSNLSSQQKLQQGDKGSNNENGGGLPSIGLDDGNGHYSTSQQPPTKEIKTAVSPKSHHDHDVNDYSAVGDNMIQSKLTVWCSCEGEPPNDTCEEKYQEQLTYDSSPTKDQVMPVVLTPSTIRSCRSLDDPTWSSSHKEKQDKGKDDDDDDESDAKSAVSA